MSGICQIGTFIPDIRIDNYQRMDQFEITPDFIENKIGVKSVSRLEPGQDTSDLCCLAYQDLLGRCADFDPKAVEIIVVVTQNPDYRLPNTASIIHGKLGFPAKCASFDISVGCSGYVYGLSVMESLMQSLGLRHGLLFTADPYSKIIDGRDKNTALLFGDAASVTYLGDGAVFKIGEFTFGTKGSDYKFLICEDNTLTMNGREIFNFAARTIPDDVKELLQKSGLTMDAIDLFLFHQASKFVIDFLAKRLGVPTEKVPYAVENYGNTVSSSIPILLKDYLTNPEINHILISGFGVGLSWASTILTRT